MNVLALHAPAPLPPHGTGILYVAAPGACRILDVAIDDGCRITKVVAGAYDLPAPPGDQTWASVFGPAGKGIAQGTYINFHVVNLTDAPLQPSGTVVVEPSAGGATRPAGVSGPENNIVNKVVPAAEPPPIQAMPTGPGVMPMPNGMAGFAPGMAGAVRSAPIMATPTGTGGGTNRGTLEAVVLPPGTRPAPIGRPIMQQGPSQVFAAGQGPRPGGPQRMGAAGSGGQVIASPGVQPGAVRPMPGAAGPGALMRQHPNQVFSPSQAPGPGMVSSNPTVGPKVTSGGLMIEHPPVVFQQGMHGAVSGPIQADTRTASEAGRRPTQEVHSGGGTVGSKTRTSAELLPPGAGAMFPQRPTAGTSGPAPQGFQPTRPQGLEIVEPGPGERAIAFARGHALAVHATLAKRIPIPPAMKMPIQAALARATMAQGARTASVLTCIVCLTPLQIGALAHCLDRGQGTMGAGAHTAGILAGLELGLARGSVTQGNPQASFDAQPFPQGGYATAPEDIATFDPSAPAVADPESGADFLPASTHAEEPPAIQATG